MGRLRRHAVDFAAIACGEHQCFFQNPTRAQLLCRALRLLGGERHSLAHLNGRRAVIQTNENNFHAVLRPLLKVAMTVREIQIYDRKTQHHNREIEDAQFRCSRPPPRRSTRQTEVKRIQGEHQQSDYVFGVVK